MRITEAEMEVIRSTFRGNETLLKLLRKIFLPEIDPAAPIGQIIDLWMTMDVKNLLPEQAMVRLIARNELITHVEQQLLQLKVLSEQEVPSEVAVAATRSKNSSK